MPSIEISSSGEKKSIAVKEIQIVTESADPDALADEKVPAPISVADVIEAAVDDADVIAAAIDDADVIAAAVDDAAVGEKAIVAAVDDAAVGEKAIVAAATFRVDQIFVEEDNTTNLCISMSFFDRDSHQTTPIRCLLISPILAERAEGGTIIGEQFLKSMLREFYVRCCEEAGKEPCLFETVITY